MVAGVGDVVAEVGELVAGIWDVDVAAANWKDHNDGAVRSRSGSRTVRYGM